MNPQLERIAKRRLPPPVARALKRGGVYPRYWAQCRAARVGYRQYGERYPHPVLFIAGLPKSGTTWLKKMVASYPGYTEVLIPEVTRWEMDHGGSHDFDLPQGALRRFREMLVVTKMHVHGSPRNVRELHESGVPCVILYRDLRDVAVSHYYYVRQTPWHPEQPAYARLSLDEALDHFRVTLLDPFADWIRSWRAHHDPARALALRYEDLLADTAGSLQRVAAHFGLPADPAIIEQVVDAHSFSRLSGGRGRGEEGTDSFFRKGVAGDWRTSFSPRMARLYAERIGPLMQELGYE
jgi:hypothetical protein